MGVRRALALSFSLDRRARLAAPLKPAVHELLIVVFVTLTTPVTLMLLTRSALYRDRTEGRSEVPPRGDGPRA